MTSYSIPPKNLGNFTNDNSQREVDASDWESKMAKLVGLSAEPPTVEVEPTEDLADLSSPLEQPQAAPTEQSLSSNPFAKLALVGSATLAVVVVAGVFLSQLMGAGNQKSAPNSLVTPVAPQPIESRQENLEQEVETLKTKLALAQQEDAVIAAQQSLRATAVPVSRSPVQATPAASRQQSIPTPVRTVYVPRTVTVVRSPANPYPQPITRPQNPIAANVVPPPPLPVVNPETKPAPPDPLEEWARLSKLGSYGQVYASNESVRQPANEPNVAPPVTNPNPTPMAQQPAPTVSQAQPQNPKSVKVGTSVKAVLATAVFGETTRSRNNDPEEAKNVFVVRLKQPLKGVDGQIALPANTELLAQINTISEQGLLQLNVVKVITQNNGSLTEINLPANALIVRGTQGKPLIANKFPNSSGSIAGMDTGLFVLGGIGKAAELFNRADTRVECANNVVNTDNGNSNSTSTNCFQVTDNRRNIAAGVLEGGLNSLVPQISQRNQQAIAQMMQQTNVWFMPAGKEVEIYVNQVVQF